MLLMALKSIRGLITTSTMIFLNLGSKQATTRFPTGCTSSPIGSPSSPTGSPDLLQDVIDLLYEIIIHRKTKKSNPNFMG